MTVQQMTTTPAPSQQQGAEPARTAAAEATRPAPQQMQAAAPTAQFTDWAAI